MNFLESLTAEWYGYQGYFVRTNIKANRRSNGGYNNEIDILAYMPSTGELVHAETSWDAMTWERREERYISKKFIFTNEQYAEIVGSVPSTIKKRAIIGTSRTQPKEIWGDDIEVTTVPNFISEITNGLKGKHPMREVIPETYPCLRSFQFVLAYG
ncbi:hypothetical protein [Aestuariibacter salexigens]|uniref:hypothetical protein n=1 Tax=Aestuariibacter salexigens TaxID=226010 RepID=UPI0006855D37|nr:hypothetical protein [Aestuariibacter salexigens]